MAKLKIVQKKDAHKDHPTLGNLEVGEIFYRVNDCDKQLCIKISGDILQAVYLATGKRIFPQSATFVIRLKGTLTVEWE